MLSLLKQLYYLNMSLEINRHFITDNMLKNVKEQNFYHIEKLKLFPVQSELF